MIFRDRIDAGKRLAEAVKARGFERPLVLGIPRGGIPVAAEVARAIGGELAAIVARKIGAPGNPELAIGATTSDGVCYLDTRAARLVGADDEYVARERERQVREAARREELFDSHRRRSLNDRNVIVVDDGIATGATAIASVRSVKAAGAKSVIIAVPVAPPSSVETLSREADEVICLSIEPDFWAVGQFYDEFDPVEDDEVRRILNAFALVAADLSREFAVQRGTVRLAGRLLIPGGPGPFPGVVFVHGLGSSKDSPRNVVIAKALVDAGIAAVLFDLSGHGDSTGDGRRDDIQTYVDDLECVWNWMRSQPDLAPERLGVAGSSMGAVVAMQAAIDGRIHPAAMVLRAPPAGPGQFRRLHVTSLVLVGSHDPLLEDVRLGAGQCTEADLSVVAGASHLFEEPGTLEEAMTRTVEWFGRTLSPSPSQTEMARARRSDPPGGAGF